MNAQAQNQATDTRILDLASRKDFDLIHKATAGLLLYVAGQLGMARDEREDVVQQAYVRLLESGKAFTLSHSKAYLVCAVRSIVIDSKRRAASRKTSVYEDWSALEGNAMWESDTAHEQAVTALGKALDLLAQDPSTAPLAWFYRDGLSVNEIKARTGKATGTITAQLCRLRQRLSPALAEAVEVATNGLFSAAVPA